MPDDDPFAAFEHDSGQTTVIKPIPGGRPPGPAVPPAARAARVERVALRERNGLNPLESAAAALLNLIVRLRNTSAHPRPEALRRQIIEEIKAFEATARNHGIGEKTVFRARYVLCTALDEVVLNTPWGSVSDWAQQSLLVTFHKEIWGGEKFFRLVEQLILDPAGNLDLLELMYLCLAFGFEGRYRLQEDGRARLEEQRDSLYRAIRNQRGEFERDLSPHWQGSRGRRNPLIQYVPLWVIAAVAAVLLMSLYLVFSLVLNRQSDPVFAGLGRLRGDIVAMADRGRPVVPVLSPPTQRSVPVRLREFLEPEIRRGLVQVIDQDDTATIRIVGDGLFDSGTAQVKAGFIPLLQRIGEELTTVQGRVLVTGHTDRIPIRTLQFPSNWHLSKARAEAVVRILAAASGQPQRFIGEGRADSEPVAGNESPQDRARNRRVDITLLARLR